MTPQAKTKKQEKKTETNKINNLLQKLLFEIVKEGKGQYMSRITREKNKIIELRIWKVKGGKSE